MTRPLPDGRPSAGPPSAESLRRQLDDARHELFRESSSCFWDILDPILEALFSLLLFFSCS